ncbi:hypothetical protein [Helicobacter canis]|uniref:Uncharacterized protein n=1 Tax=Helicobacter canis TaxID=29419 RepID=A0A377J624_9HELI|nr:hypothetical protein [Helicobacter canis]STO97724.1 Uncharacterised protein [Helicobacter canis]
MGYIADKRGGGGKYLRDSACGLESRISSPRFVDRPLVLSSLRGLKSPDSISTILESYTDSQKHKTRRSRSFFSKSTASSSTLPKSTKSHDSISTILESQSDTEAQITNNAQPLESFADSLAFLAFSKVDSSSTILESIALESKTLSLRDTASAVAWQSTQTKTQILESTFSHNAPFLSLRAVCHTNPLLSSRDLRQQGVAIHKSAKADSKKNAQNTNPLESTFEKMQMDCRAIATALARNDSINNAYTSTARNDKNNATILNTPHCLPKAESPNAQTTYKE